MSLLTVLAIFYALGGIGTIGFHLLLIVGPIGRPWRVLLSGLFWPVCLPVLIAASRERL